MADYYPNVPDILKDAFPYLYVTPNGKQEEFLAMNSFINLFIAANKVGKTAIGAIKLIRAMKTKKIRARVISDPTLIEGIVVPEIEKWLGQELGAWVVRQRGHSYNSYFKAPNGSVCDVMTYEQKPKEFEGVPLDYLWLDEPPPQSIWGACTSRFLTDNEEGQINMTFTPLLGAAWVHDDLILKADGKRISHVFADIEANCKQHGINGRLDHDRIKLITEEYDEEEKEARTHGKFGFLLGRVYDFLNASEHKIDHSEVSFEPETQFYCIVDPHDRKYPCFIWVGLDSRENAIIYDEWPKEPYEKLKSCPYTNKEIISRVKEIEAGHADLYNNGQRIKFTRIMDPNFGGKISQQTGRTTAQDYAYHGKDDFDPFMFFMAKNNMDLGHKAVRAAFKGGKCKISSRCRNTWHYLYRYAWEENRGHSIERKSLSELVSDKYKDWSDNVRYFWLSWPTYKRRLLDIHKEPDKVIEAHKKIAMEQMGRRSEMSTDIRELI